MLEEWLEVCTRTLLVWVTLVGWGGGLGAALELWHRLRKKGAGIKTNIGVLGKERRENNAWEHRVARMSVENCGDLRMTEF